MPRYHLTCLDYCLQSGRAFTVTVCGYSGKVRHMVIGDDTLRHLRRHCVDVTNSCCEASRRCLALSCSLNQTVPLHLAHMLEMQCDEPLDDETSKMWDTESTVEALVKFADKMNGIIPNELRQRQEPVS